ncbi:Chitotriosidase-1 [Araneus ventricosus]|uniref:Chitotriosidase-1 n=1 Tax=Araneus ventricosus TaxID=182803 RepID=A0A4Y2ENA0_ARAVE|nr:Chitotriosidase-1 [Araneus ventricosus]
MAAAISSMIAVIRTKVIHGPQRGIKEDRRVLDDLDKGQSQESKLVCYYSNWAVYRPGLAKFTPENINPYLCTHIIYAFASLSEEFQIQPFDPYNDMEQGNYRSFVSLKAYNPNLKTMIAVGGWNEGSKRFSRLVESADNRRTFILSVMAFLREYGFDGVDLDWEYPAFREGGNHTTDKKGYALLVKELRQAIDDERFPPEKERLLLSVAVPATKEYIDQGFDVPEISRNAHFLNLLTYDYHSAYEPETHHHAPLYPPEGLNPLDQRNQLNVIGSYGNKLVDKFSMSAASSSFYVVYNYPILLTISKGISWEYKENQLNPQILFLRKSISSFKSKHSNLDLS